MFSKLLNAQFTFKNTDKNYWAINYGITYKYSNKDIYYKGQNNILYGQITPFPGVYLYPTTTFHTSVTKNLNLFNNFYIGLEVMYYNNKVIRYSPPDTILKYPIFSDSIINTLPYQKGHWPVLSKKNSNSFRLTFPIGYQLKRFFIFIKFYINIINIEFSNNLYIDNRRLKYFNTVTFFEAIDDNMPFIEIQYQILKSKSIYLYFRYNQNYLTGIELRF